jgi:hypothetical protein
MAAPNKVIIGIFTGTLSVGYDKVLKGEKAVAVAAHSLYEHFGDQQRIVAPYKPKLEDYGYVMLGRLYKIVGYEILDQELLMEWWYEL